MCEDHRQTPLECVGRNALTQLHISQFITFIKGCCPFINKNKLSNNFTVGKQARKIN